MGVAFYYYYYSIRVNGSRVSVYSLFTSDVDDTGLGVGSVDYSAVNLWGRVIPTIKNKNILAVNFSRLDIT